MTLVKQFTADASYYVPETTDEHYYDYFVDDSGNQGKVRSDAFPCELKPDLESEAVRDNQDQSPSGIKAALEASHISWDAVLNPYRLTIFILSIVIGMFIFTVAVLLNTQSSTSPYTGENGKIILLYNLHLSGELVEEASRYVTAPLYCHQACLTHKNCTHWTWFQDIDHIREKNRLRCWLKKTSDPTGQVQAQSRNGCVSGIGYNVNADTTRSIYVD